MEKFVVVTVSNIQQREKLIKKMYTNLTADKVMLQSMTVIQSQANKIQVYQNLPKGRKFLVKTYLVIVIPVQIDLGPIYNICGDVTFELSETIKNIKDLLTRLESLQGHRIMKGGMNEQTFEELVGRLSCIDGG